MQAAHCGSRKAGRALRCPCCRSDRWMWADKALGGHMRLCTASLHEVYSRLVDETGSDTAVQLADDIARVCADAGYYRGLLLESGAAPLVDAVLKAARSSDTREGRLEIEALRKALRNAGHPDGLSAERTAVPSSGIIRRQSDPPRERLFLCPLRRCSRYWFPVAHRGESVPICGHRASPARPGLARHLGELLRPPGAAL